MACRRSPDRFPRQVGAGLRADPLLAGLHRAVPVQSGGARSSLRAWIGAAPSHAGKNALELCRAIFHRLVRPDRPMSSPSADSKLPRLARARVCLSCASRFWSCTGYVVWLGKDTSWDFRNYHWYIPYAFLNERMGFDVAVAHQATLLQSVPRHSVLLAGDPHPFLVRAGGAGRWCRAPTSCRSI